MTTALASLCLILLTLLLCWAIPALIHSLHSIALSLKLLTDQSQNGPLTRALRQVAEEGEGPGV